MANTIIPKKSSVASAVPTPAQLAVGEIAFNLADRKIYSKNASGTVIEMGGGSGSTAYYTRTTATATASQTTFSVTYQIGYVDVWLNGVKLAPSEFTATNGTSVVLATGAAAGAQFEAISWNVTPTGGGSISDGDKGDITVSGSGATWTIDAQAVTAAKISGSGSTAGQALVSTGSGTAPAYTTLTLENLPDSAFKRSVRAATTANITLSGTQTIDGIALVAGDRVLVKNQTTTSANGIYIVASGAWTRALDADAASELAGATVNVDSGTVNGGKLYETDFKTTDTLGTTAMSWAQIVDDSSAQTLTNKTISGASNTITNVSLTTGVTGTLPLANGGTGGTTKDTARVGLGITVGTTAPGSPAVNDLWVDTN